MNKASVPQVWPVEDAKYKMGELIEKGLEVYRLSGEIDLLDKAVKLAREFYDSEMKIAGHRGQFDWSYLNQILKALEKVEAFIDLVKADNERIN